MMEPFKPDKTDFDILRLLQQDSSMRYKELAGKLSKSITAISDRIKKLNAAGYIERTVAFINLQKIGPNFIAFPHISLTNHLESALSDFKDKMIAYPEVMECYQLTGQFDFMLKVIFRNITEYHTFLKEKISILPYVGSVQSFLALSEVKRTTAYPFL